MWKSKREPLGRFSRTGNRKVDGEEAGLLPVDAGLLSTFLPPFFLSHSPFFYF
jgi:hypothetical protein